MKFEAENGAEELVVLNGAFAQLCTAGATEEERDRVQLVLLELAQDGVTGN